jgi:hypothetical protein
LTAGPQAHGSHRAEAQPVLPDERVLEAAVFVLNRRTPKWGLGIGPLSALIASVEFLLRVGRRTGADISGKTLWAVTDDSLYIWEIPEGFDGTGDGWKPHWGLAAGRHLSPARSG